MNNLLKKIIMNWLICLKVITDRSAEDEINKVLKMPIDFSNACECSDFWTASVSSMYIFTDIKHIFDLYHIEMPDISSVCDTV